ncbi:hypothetical protein EDB86DRAFT_3079306 [Lactarius hatsudake]|nr:hypothetical protein EDB86DRAFT_3079306 [Lactarius hatsudake]
MTTTPIVSTIQTRHPVEIILENLTVPSQDLGVPSEPEGRTPYSVIPDSPPIPVLALATSALASLTEESTAPAKSSEPPQTLVVTHSINTPITVHAPASRHVPVLVVSGLVVFPYPLAVVAALSDPGHPQNATGRLASGPVPTLPFIASPVLASIADVLFQPVKLPSITPLSFAITHCLSSIHPITPSRSQDAVGGRASHCSVVEIGRRSAYCSFVKPPHSSANVIDVVCAFALGAPQPFANLVSSSPLFLFTSLRSIPFHLVPPSLALGSSLLGS